MTGRQLAILGGMLVAVGSLSPWATVTTALGSDNLSGTQGMGGITLVAGVMVMLLGFGRMIPGRRAWGRFAMAAGGIASIAIGTINYALVTSMIAAADLGRLDSLFGSQSAVATAGIGLYLVIVGGVVLLVGSLTGKVDLVETDARQSVIERSTPSAIDVRRSIKWIITASGCLILSGLAFAGVIGWADLSLVEGQSQSAALAGMVTVVASVLGLYLLLRIVRGARSGRRDLRPEPVVGAADKPPIESEDGSTRA